MTAFILGAGFWYFFGTNSGLRDKDNNSFVLNSNQNSAVSNAKPKPKKPAPTPTPEIEAPAGEVEVSAGEVTLGGGKSKMPLRRISVSNFAIGETEVTNAQYSQFVEAAEYKAPADWKDGKFPAGDENKPVVNIGWADANAYCEWLSKKIGAAVRLPTEAEWERAARGDTENKYPWGDKWKNDAAPSIETDGKILPVQSLPEGRSPFGAYEMIGNVWEWTGDLEVDEFGKPVLYEPVDSSGKPVEYEKTKEQRIIKGGSAQEEREFLTIDRHAARPEMEPSDVIGFRYVVIRKQ